MMSCYSKIAVFLAPFVMMLASIPSVRAQTGAIIIAPDVTIAAPGEFFEVHIALDSDVINVGQYVVHLKYDTNVVRFDTAWADPAWDSLCDWTYFRFRAEIEFEEDSSSGDSLWHLLVFDVIARPETTIDGYAEIATLQFEAMASGVTDVYFEIAVVKDRDHNVVVESVENGILYVCPFLSGNVDGNPGIDISDLVCLVDYMFTGGLPPIPNVLAADVNCNLVVDISDLVYLVDYMFTGGPVPCDSCP